METKTVIIPAITCGHCIRNIRIELEDLPGVETVEGEPQTRKITVHWQAPADWETIARTLTQIGYPPEPDGTTG